VLIFFWPDHDTAHDTVQVDYGLANGMWFYLFVRLIAYVVPWRTNIISTSKFSGLLESQAWLPSFDCTLVESAQPDIVGPGVRLPEVLN